MNLSYITTPSGIVRILEWIFGTVAWCCVVSDSTFKNSSNLVYGVTVLIIFWLLGLVLFSLSLFDEQWREKLPKLSSILSEAILARLEIVISILGALFIFIAASCIAVDACDQKNFIASHGNFGKCMEVYQNGAACAFIESIVWLADSLLAWKKIFGTFCWEERDVERLD